MPFFVYGSNARTGEVAKRFYSEAATEDEARAHAQAHGMRVSAVVGCSAQQRAPEVDVVQVRGRIAAAHSQRTPVMVRGAAARAAAASAGTTPRATVDPQLKAEMEQFEQQLENYTPSVYVAYVLVGVNLLVFAAMTAFGVSLAKPTAEDLLRWGADFGPSTAHGQWWRLFTSMFVHIGPLHVVSNMLVLAYMGPRVERIVGNVSFVLVYLVSGLAGSLLALEQNPLQVQAGASGAIFGIYGVLFALLLRQRGAIPPHVAAHLKKYVTVFIAYNLMYSLSPGISLAAHLGGLLSGFACGWVISQPLDTAEALAQRPARNAAVAALGALLVVAGVFAVHTKYPDLGRVDEVIEHFAAVEKTSRTEFADAKQRADQGKLSDADFANLIEGRMLPSWHAASDELGRIAYLPSRQIVMLNDYMHMRQHQLESLAAALRSSDGDAVAGALEDGKYSSDRLASWGGNQ